MRWICLSIPKLQWCSHWCLGLDKWLHPARYIRGIYLSILEMGLWGPWRSRATVIWQKDVHKKVLLSFASWYVLEHTILFNVLNPEAQRISWIWYPHSKMSTAKIYAEQHTLCFYQANRVILTCKMVQRKIQKYAFMFPYHSPRLNIMICILITRIVTIVINQDTND